MSGTLIAALTYILEANRVPIEYQDKSSVSKFLGAAPGYVGFSDGAPLVNALERRQGKGSIVLLDELEKADPDILTYGNHTLPNFIKKKFGALAAMVS